MRPLCIYHGNCADGFGSAWVVWRFFGGFVELFPGIYQNPPPDVKDRDVIIVDFSYKRPVMQEIAAKAKSVLVLDHHKTAMEDLTPKDNFIAMFNPTWEGFQGNVAQDVVEGAGTQIYVVFDMNRSGSGITWDFFYPDEKRPTLINHIEDRDLWKFALPHTREIQAALFSYEYEIDLWDQLINDVNLFGTDDMVMEGAAIERKHHKDIAELLKVTTRDMIIGGVVVPVANLPYTMTSDAGHKLCEKFDAPFAACYWDTPEGRQFSLRSREGGTDVGEIAKQYGGGGHKNASGFRIPWGEHDLAQGEPP
jgi:oligoribonuclease NrnB/cAMP/cGMP phosphodiesterase (DHH superfamily)